MDLIENGQFNLTGLSKINVLLGKNGSGKSELLKKMERHLTQQNNGEINYVTPERGGALRFEAGIEQNVITAGNWAKDQKRQNQWPSFKHYSVAQYRRLETLSLREIEKNPEIRGDFTNTFDSVINKINNLLTNVKIVRTSRGDFEIFTINLEEKIEPQQISSGESEIIALAIECLTFEKSCDPARQNFLLLDEPDVHLHPDLQGRFMSFLVELLNTDKFSVIIATHSTAVLGALFENGEARFAILANRSPKAIFRPINTMYQGILPIFGANPLSNVFNQSPIILVEGEDDVRILQQAIRSSNGQLKLYPCSVDGVGNLSAYEAAVIEIITGVYDNATAYSLRDRDEGDEGIQDTVPLIRFKTSCRAMENLIICDEVLTTLGLTWPSLEAGIENWLVAFAAHEKSPSMQAFKDSGYNRKSFDLKEIRNILMGLTSSTKPWEVAVGQTIGRLASGEILKDFAENKLCNYLGNRLANKLKT